MIFEPGAPACTRGAPSTTHPLPHFLKGALSPAENATAKKRGPSGTHGSLCLFEHGRPHKIIRSYYVFAMRTRTGSHAKSPRAPPFRQTVGKNDVRGITAHRPPSGIAHKQRNHAKRARGGGAGTPGTPQPPGPGIPPPPGHPSIVSFNEENHQCIKPTS